MLMGYNDNSKNEHVKSLKYGKDTEPVVKKMYCKIYNGKHKDVTTSDCGLLVDMTYPFLAASPDMLVSCSCRGDGVLEVKCPLIIKCDKCSSFCLCSVPSYLMRSDDKLYLKRYSMYHAQIQWQLAITGRKWCDFFDYTVNGNVVQRIKFDSVFYENYLKNLVQLFNMYVFSELLNRSLEKRLTAVPTTCEAEPMDVQNTSDKFVNFCPVCKGVIKDGENVKLLKDRSVCCDSCQGWFHFKCAKKTKSTLSKVRMWFCEECKYFNKYNFGQFVILQTD